MNIAALDWLRCPFCGTRLDLVDGQATVRQGDEIIAGVLGCQCCAFPIVDGIPVLIADDTTRTGMHQLEAGESEAALFTLLGLDDARAEAFRAFLRRGLGATYRDGLAILSVDAEAQYFVYRFSDPTFLVAQALLRALGTHPRLTRRTIDLCGGSGHLTRVLGALSPGRNVLADVYFWKLWLAKHFTAPQCEPVCCDANHPLPFAGGVFSMVICSDAFPYIWHKRLLAGEMTRLAGDDGAVVMPHLHSALGENFTAGMTLTPRAYVDLFEGHGPRLFRDSALLDGLLDADVVDLSHDSPPESLAGEAALALITSPDPGVFRRYDVPVPPAAPQGDTVVVNPLYRAEFKDGVSTLTLVFPTDEYAAEFAAARRYLPDTVRVRADVTKPFDPLALGSDAAELKRRLVLLDVPRLYC
jgi:uncharacterized protein YbaR (Trm112 family)